MSSLKDAVAGQIIRGAIDLGARLTEKATSVNSATTLALDCSLGNVFDISMISNITTLSFSNVPASGKAYAIVLKVKQDATGNRSVTWPASVKWPNGTAPTLTATANKYDVIVLFTLDGGTTWSGSVSSQNY